MKAVITAGTAIAARIAARRGAAAAAAVVTKHSRAVLKQAATAAGVWAIYEATDKIAPGFIDSVIENLVDKGIDLLGLSSGDARKVLLSEAAQLGVDIDESHGLTKTEARGYRQMVATHAKKLAHDVDENQTKHEDTIDEDRMYATAALFVGMKRTCDLLGVTGYNKYRRLYEAITIFNSVTEKDVIGVETHERLYGPIR